jgi:enamine deaminase RidA (YjgF/YER057c/UK114 family)
MTDIKTITSDNPRPIAHYSEATLVDGFIFAAGQLASDFKTGVAPEARKHPNFPYYGSDIKLQTRYILDNIARTFAAGGSSLDSIVKAQVFLTDLNDFAGFDEVWREYFKVPPPRTTVGMGELLIKDTIIEIDVIGYGPSALPKHMVITSDNPKPLANYSEAIRVGDMLFAAGQLASDFKAGVAPEARRDPSFPYYGSDIQLQTEYVLRHLQRTFEAAGSSLDHVVKAQVFLTDLNDFAGFDQVWKKYFKVPPPRTTVGTTGLLVRDSLVEIDLTGYIPRPELVHQIVSSSGQKPLANYSEAFTIGNFVFAAGQLPSDFVTGIAPEARRHEAFPYYGSDIKLQTTYIMNNLKRTFEAAGSGLDRIVKAQVFLTDLAHFNGFDELWKTYFDVPPPRTTVKTSGLLVKDALIEIDLIGVKR